MKKKILIIGGAGYIGSTLSTFLVNQKYDVTVVDILKYSKSSLSHLLIKKNFKLLIQNAKKIKTDFYKKFDFIIPLVGLVGAPLCEKNKKEAKELNLEFIKKLCKNLSAKNKIIYLNTNSGYGIGKKDKFCDENSPLNPISLYGRTKKEAENEIINSRNNFIILRLATVFGYSYRMRSDLLVNNFVSEALKKNKLELYESNFRRNFIHIHDVCNAIIFMINKFNKNKNNIFNLGHPKANITKLDLAKKIQKKLKKLKLQQLNNKSDPDKRDYFVSNSKIIKAGYKPTVSIDEGINEMIEVFMISGNEKIKNNY